jgi:glycosyltransferase involved in cell wall biosynthesis
VAKFERYILWFPGQHNPEVFGFARVRSRIIMSLRRAGFTVVDGGYDPPPDCIQISYGQPFEHREYRLVWDRKPGVKASIGFTSFESSNLPKGWAEACEQHDAIWTTSNFCVDVLNKDLAAKGIVKSVKNITHGVDPGCFPLMDRPVRGTSPSDPFTFLWRGLHPLDRKRGYFVEEIFQRIKLPNWKLIMKYAPGAANRHMFVNRKNVDWICEYWHDEQLRAALFNTDCLVQPSRCEGFGLEPLESLATGQPVIITKFSGYLDYLYSGKEIWDNNTQIFKALGLDPDKFTNSEGVPSGMSVGLDWVPSDSFYKVESKRVLKKEEDVTMRSLLHADWDYGQDAFVSNEALADAMIYAYDHRGALKMLSREASRIVHRDFNWNMCAKDIYDGLCEIIEPDKIAYESPRIWLDYLNYLHCSGNRLRGPSVRGVDIPESDDLILPEEVNPNVH